MEEVKKDIEKSGLADATKKTLYSRINRLYATEPFPKSLVKKVVPGITANKASQLAYFQSILSISRISGVFKDAITQKQVREVLKESEKLKDEESERRDKGEERENDLSWDEVKACKEKFPKGSEARLIYLLYTELPPLRADFTPMEIVDSKEKASDENMNYYVKASKPYMLVRVYKTASKYGEQRLDVTKELADAIPQDQKYLFEFDGEPMQPNTLSKKVVRAFKKYCDMHVTINTLRRSYAKHTMSMSKDEQIEKALEMGHSLSVHKEYSRRGKDENKNVDKE
jgi:integrase